jgi:regulator of replication initiation timing
MSYEENEALWQQLRQRLARTHEMLEEKAQTEDLEVKRAATRGLYHQGWTITNLMYCRPSRDRPAASEAAELAVIQQSVEEHEAAVNQI